MVGRQGMGRTAQLGASRGGQDLQPKPAVLLEMKAVYCTSLNC